MSLQTRLFLAALGAAALSLYAPGAAAQREVINLAPAQPPRPKPPPKPKPVVEAPKPKADEPPPKPTLLLTEEEKAARPQTATVDVTPVGLQETTYRKKIDRNLVTLRVRPGEPLPNRMIEIEFEVLKALPIPDPRYGDRAPAVGATLVVGIIQEGSGGTALAMRQLHPTPSPGVYAMRFSVPKAGQYRVEMKQVGEELTSGERPIHGEFILGIGQPTPKMVSNDFEDETNTIAGHGRTTLSTRKVDPNSAKVIMKTLGERWIDLLVLLSIDATPEQRQAVAAEIADLAARASANPPKGVDEAVYQKIAEDFETQVRALSGATADVAQAKAMMTMIETASCAKCHMPYRFKLTDSVAAWPKFTPKAP